MEIIFDKNILNLLYYVLYMNQLVNVKERTDMILEPLQVMTQLSILSHCPIGTKLSIYDNILHLQRPTMFQGAYRWWNEDKKDDLYYLFNAIKRYYKWYKWQDNVLFKYILDRAIDGLSKLKKTYDEVGNNLSISQTLSLYKNILDMKNLEVFKDVSGNNNVSMDTVFIKIKKEYNKETLRVIYNSLMILEKTEDESDKKEYIDGLLLLLSPVHKKIKIWINENLSC